MKDWPIAVLDILGFKSITENYDIEDIHSAYKSSIDITLRAAQLFPKNNFIYNIYSDSIIVFPKDNKREDLLALIDICRLFLYGVFCTSVRTLPIFLPMRGAISIGEFIYTNDTITKRNINILAEYNTNILIGKAIVDAYQWEKKQKWIGISLTEKAKYIIETDKSKNIDNLISDNILVKYNVPTEEGNINSYAINSIDKTQINAVINSFSHMMEGHDDIIKYKYQNTIDFIKYIDKNNLFYPKQP